MADQPNNIFQDALTAHNRLKRSTDLSLFFADYS